MLFAHVDYECPPNGSGMLCELRCCKSVYICVGVTTLIALGILDQLQAQGKFKSLADLEHNSPEFVQDIQSLAF